MAALIRHGPLFINETSILFLGATANSRKVFARFKSKVPPRNINSKFEATQQSLSSKGFLRPYKPYQPIQGVEARIDKICESRGIPTGNETKLDDLVIRFKIFVDCNNEFNHSVPNSMLHSIETIGDLKEFYLTPVDTVTPLDALKRMDLPKNLHVQYEYHRFHPDMDTAFNGKTAFPASSTLVTGLKYKKKYPGHKQEDPWLQELMRLQ